MEQIKINKSYFKLQGQSNSPATNPTPKRNRIYTDSYDTSPRDWDGRPMNQLSHEEYQEIQRYKEFKIRMQEAKHSLEQVKRRVELMERLDSLEGMLNRAEPEEIRKESAENFLSTFKRRWF